MKHISFTNTFHKRNQIGLYSAYRNDNKISIKNDTMFLAGTTDLQDVRNDFKKTIPFDKVY